MPPPTAAVASARLSKGLRVPLIAVSELVVSAKPRYFTPATGLQPQTRTKLHPSNRNEQKRQFLKSFI